jgi:hypothetical protein
MKIISYMLQQDPNKSTSEDFHPLFQLPKSLIAAITTQLLFTGNNNIIIGTNNHGQISGHNINSNNRTINKSYLLKRGASQEEMYYYSSDDEKPRKRTRYDYTAFGG